MSKKDFDMDHRGSVVMDACVCLALTTVLESQVSAIHTAVRYSIALPVERFLSPSSKSERDVAITAIVDWGDRQDWPIRLQSVSQRPDERCAPSHHTAHARSGKDASIGAGYAWQLLARNGAKVGTNTRFSYDEKHMRLSGLTHALLQLPPMTRPM